MDLKKIEINERFAEALARMEEGGAPLFVTGKAGTGKSTLLEYFRATTKRRITYLKASDVKSRRVIRPLEVGEMEYAGVPFPGVRGICKLRNDERVFRVDRILEMKVV